MDIVNSYLLGWQKIFVYKGNATRCDFWSFLIINILILATICFISYYFMVGIAADPSGEGGFKLVWWYYVYAPLRKYSSLILIFPLVSLGIRRMHDIGRSGWWFGVPLIIGGIITPMVDMGICTLMNKSFVNIKFLYYSGFFTSALRYISLLFSFWLCIQSTRKINDEN